MAVPRLTEQRCFLRLDPARLRTRLAQAATIKGAARLGEPMTPSQLGHIDLIVAGSVLRDDIPMTAHDVPVDLVVTPERVIRTRTAHRKPEGIRWQELSRDQLAAIPVLRRFAVRRTAGRARRRAGSPP